MLVVYLGALLLLFLSAFWRVNAFTSAIERQWGLQNFRTLFGDPVYRTIALRTMGIAAAVTLADIALAFPLAYYAARIASSREKAVLLVAVVLPLWSSYLIRVFAWKLILQGNGFLNWVFQRLGTGGLNIGSSYWGIWLVFTYLWLPFVALPIYTALERIPTSYLEASSDLGARGFTTFRRVIWPLAFPGAVAGSIFAFSLTLGDYISALPDREDDLHRQRGVRRRRRGEQCPVRGGVRPGAGGDHGRLPLPGPAAGCLRGALAVETKWTRIVARLGAYLTLLFLYVPLALIFLYAFNPARGQTWPPPGLTTHWFGVAWQNGEVRSALVASVEAGLGATSIRPGPRQHGGLRRAPVPVLRAGDALLRPGPAHRVARHRDRHGAQLRDQLRRRPVRIVLRSVHDHRRPRHVLRGAGLQQRAWPGSAGRRPR